jgi:hypothetical protein
MKESCNLIGLLSVAAQAALALIIVGAMLRRRLSPSEETYGESAPQVAGVPVGHL